MKKILMIAAMAFLATGGFAQGTVISGPDINFETTTHDFGKITEGTQAKYVFKFTNTGRADLVISNVSTPCGCTTPSYSHDPIAPGKSGEIAINFNSTGKSGHFNKVCVVTTNKTDNKEASLTISGEVDPKAAETTTTGK